MKVDEKHERKRNLFFFFQCTQMSLPRAKNEKVKLMNNFLDFPIRKPIFFQEKEMD